MVVQGPCWLIDVGRITALGVLKAARNIGKKGENGLAELKKRLAELKKVCVDVLAPASVNTQKLCVFTEADE